MEIDEFTGWKILSKDISTFDEAEKYVIKNFGDKIESYAFMELTDDDKDRADKRSFREYEVIGLSDGTKIGLSSNAFDKDEHLLLLIS